MPVPAPVQRLLVVIPALNEAEGIRRIVAAVRRQIDAEVLVVDDGSVDATAAEARAAGAIVASHAVNLGYGAALQTGYRYALREGFAGVVHLDADGQHDPASIPALVAGLRTHDIVVGSRFLDGTSYRPPRARRLGMWIFGGVAALLSGKQVTDPTSGFQAISRDALRFYAHERFPPDYPDADVLAMVVRAGLRLTEVPVTMHAARPGRSMHAGILKQVYYALRMSLALFMVPLRNEKR